MKRRAHGAGRRSDLLAIDALVQATVVADVFGKIEQGPVIGDNLATAIYANSGNGVVHDAAVRDLEGIEELEGFTSFVRGWDPSYASPTIMLSGMNCPIRIGHATCMPGDIVLGKRGRSLYTAASGRKGRHDLRSCPPARHVWQAAPKRRRTPGQIDRRWSDDIEADFSRWLEDHIDDLLAPKKQFRNC